MTHKKRIEKLEKVAIATAPDPNPYMTMPAGELIQIARDYLAETAGQDNPTRAYIAKRLQAIEENRQ
jgi:hypothetical protein